MSTADSRARLHVVRVSKTGSTTLKSLTREYNRDHPGGRQLVFNSHNASMPAILAEHPDDQVVFFLRDPVARFVSGFNSRLREGRNANIAHSAQEKLTFERFPTPNALAEALSSPDNVEQDRAYAGVASMMHTSVHYRGWVGDVEYLARRLDRIAFVGMQESFDDDVRRLFGSLGWERDAEIEVRHQAPPTASTFVSELAKQNLRAWYADDYALVEWVASVRDRWADGATLNPPLSDAERGGQDLDGDERRAARRARRARRERREQRARRAGAQPVVVLPAVGDESDDEPGS